MSKVKKKVFCLFGGSGGGAKGFKRATARVGQITGEWECIGSIDVDEASNRDFARLVGTRATTMDLADRSQYIAIRGHEPPAGWRESTPDDVRRAAGYQRPDCIFLSAPCKGFSGLLSEAKSRTDKYQGMNQLTTRGVWLSLEAWRDDPVPIYVFENVPRLLTRGRHLADQICSMFRAFGYAVAETVHDCGVIGGLAQSRKRCLIVARHVEKVPPFLYQPAQRQLRAVGDVLGKMLLPGALRAGPMHRIPQLQWKTWVRLAFVEAGSDWRSLNKLAVEDGMLRDYLLVPDRPYTGHFSVADARASSSREGSGYLGVKRWDEHSGAVTANGRPGAGAFSVADVRVEQADGWNRGQHYGVHGWGETSGAVTGQGYPNQGRYAVADMRVPPTEFHGFRIVRWDRSAGTVTGARAPGSSAQAVADPRTGTKLNNCFRVVDSAEPAPTVTAGGGPSAGGLAVADMRCQTEYGGKGKYLITPYDAPANTVIGASTTGQGAFAVADVRGPQADRPFGKYHVADWDGAARTVIGSDDNGAYAVADVRGGMDPERGHYLSGGHYGVIPWNEHSGAVSSAACHDNGRWSVADPRLPYGFIRGRTLEQMEPVRNAKFAWKFYQEQFELKLWKRVRDLISKYGPADFVEPACMQPQAAPNQVSRTHKQTATA